MSRKIQNTTVRNARSAVPCQRRTLARDGEHQTQGTSAGWLKNLETDSEKRMHSRLNCHATAAAVAKDTQALTTRTCHLSTSEQTEALTNQRKKGGQYAARKVEDDNNEGKVFFFCLSGGLYIPCLASICCFWHGVQGGRFFEYPGGFSLPSRGWVKFWTDV